MKKFHDHSCYKYLKIPFTFFKQKLKYFKNISMNMKINPQIFQVACNYIKTEKGLQFPNSTDPQIFRWLAITLRLTRGYNFHTQLTHQFCRLFDFDTYQCHPSVRPCPQA